MPRNKTYATKAKSINDKIVAELVQARKTMQPELTRAALAETLDIEPSTTLRLENGQFKLTTERFFEIESDRDNGKDFRVVARSC